MDSICKKIKEKIKDGDCKNISKNKLLILMLCDKIVSRNIYKFTEVLLDQYNIDNNCNLNLNYIHDYNSFVEFINEIEIFKIHCNNDYYYVY